MRESHRDCGSVQDAYSLRCMPQVHGAVRDALDYVTRVHLVEMNAATDNPMVFAETGEILSGGNFHGQPVAIAADLLAIAAAQLSGISERRIERLVNPALSGLPAFLAREGGLHSGLMMAQVTAAALVSENKTLAHPASVDSIPTSAGKEDHVSMGPTAAWKAARIVENTSRVLAIELLVACEALDFRRPLRSSPPLEAVHALVRTHVPAHGHDRTLSPEIEALAVLASSGAVLAARRGRLRDVGVAMTSEARTVRAPRGTTLSCRSWQQEAALRMLMNNLDPEVAERPQDLVVYGGIGKAARNWECFDAIVRALRELGNDETLLVQSGKPVGVFRTHTDAPRVLISNSMLVPAWATWEHFYELDRKGLTMYGQMTAGSWIYIGTQGILQGTYETFAEAARQHFGGSLAGRLVLTAGLGGMGGAQPLAATMNEGVLIAVEVDEKRIARRLETGYLDLFATTVGDALARAREALETRRPLSIGLLGNAADVLPELLRRGVVPDLVTDQTSAHDPLNGYVPNRMSYEQAQALRVADPTRYMAEARRSMGEHVQAMLDLKAKGSIVFDYGNNIRAEAQKAGVSNAFDFPGFVPAYIRPLFCEGKGPFRWACLSGDPDDICARPTKPSSRPSRTTRRSPAGSALARERVKLQGLPARICWLGYGERAKAGLVFNELVAHRPA